MTKGVESLLADFDEGGFFKRVLIAFPLARTTSSAQVSQRVAVRDIGTDWMPFGDRSRWVRRLGAPLHLLRTLGLLASAVRRERLDLVRATDPCFSGVIGWAVARLTQRPLCVSIHADFDKRHDLGGPTAGVTILGSRRLARTVERFVLRHAEMVLPIRDSLCGYALGLGARAERIRVIPHGADLREFVEPVPLSADLGLPSDKKIVSFVGRLVRENYIDDLLQLARALGAVRDDFTLVVVGGGTELDRVAAEVGDDEMLHRIVRLLGFQPRSAVAAIRQASAVSLCLMGGFSLIEACAAGSPVVSYDVEWHHELVKNGETGFLVLEHDVKGLVAAVQRLLDDPALGARLGKAARSSAILRHDLEATSAVKRQCYGELLAGSSRTPR